MSDGRELERHTTPGERIALSVADQVAGWRGLANAIDDEINQLQEELNFARGCRPDVYEHILASERAAHSRARDLERERDRLREAVKNLRELFRKIVVNADNAFAGDSWRGPKPFVDLILQQAQEGRAVATTLIGD
jgi:hypothetical protein